MEFCFYFSRNYFALICQMGTLKEFMDHYDKLVPNIYVPEPGIMEVLLCCNVVILSFKLTYIMYYIEMFYLSNDLNPLLLILDIPFLAHVWLYLVVSSSLSTLDAFFFQGLFSGLFPHPPGHEAWRIFSHNVWCIEKFLISLLCLIHDVPLPP